MVEKYLPDCESVPSKGMKPKWSKKDLASCILVFPGIIPQKQGTSQFNGSFRSGWIVPRACVGSRVSSRVGMAVNVGVAVTVATRVAVRVAVNV